MKIRNLKGTKKLMSDSPGLADFAVWLLDSTFGQVKVFGEIFSEEN